MDIELAKYVLTPSGNNIISVKLKNSGALVLNIPLDPNNTDYQAIQEWVAEGNTIQEAD
jgi:hypothetical protein